MYDILLWIFSRWHIIEFIIVIGLLLYAYRDDIIDKLF